MKRIGSIAGAVVMMTAVACASGPTYGPADDKALDPVRKDYEQCIGRETTAVIDGSDDVPFLVQNIITACDPTLQAVEAYLRKRGFKGYFIGNYLNGIRQEASQVTGSYILKTKAAGYR